MQRRALGRLSVWLVACACLTAAEFWEEKPFLEWSNGQTEKMMTDSPWAAVVTVALPPQLPGAGAGGGGGGRGGGDDISFGQVRRIPIGVSWRSALPVRQALVRSQVGQRGVVSAEHQGFLSSENPSYIVALSGLPMQYTRPGGGATIEAFLRRDGKPPIPAQQGGMEKAPGGVVLLIAFPKTDPIALENGDVEFVAKLDRLEIKKKFKLKDMVFGGKLDL
jgi:hypothetical protein